MNTLDYALSYWDSGLNVIPILIDGSRGFPIKWKPFQNKRLPRDQIIQWFMPDIFGNSKYGIAIICGTISYSLEVLDFDDFLIWVKWLRLIEKDKELFDLVRTMPLVATPSNGRHLYMCCCHVCGNTKLAGMQKSKDDYEVWIETRGEKGIVVAPGGPDSVHPSGLPYRLISSEISMPKIPLISWQNRRKLWEIAMSLSACKKTVAVAHAKLKIEEEEEEDKIKLNIFEHKEISEDGTIKWFEKNTTWEQILEPHGWIQSHTSGNKTYWRRPNKTIGVSAVTGINDKNIDTFHCFSTSVPIFENTTSDPEKEPSYTKLTVYRLLNFNHDNKKISQRLTYEAIEAQRSESLSFKISQTLNILGNQSKKETLYE